jgi:aspartate/methionine/tyrosine aminotransferase
MMFHDPQGKLKEVKKVCKALSETYGHPTQAIPLPILVAGTRSLLAMVKVHNEIANAQEVKGPMDESMAMLSRLQRQRDYICKRISDIDGVSVVKSMATLYMFPKIESFGKVWKTNEDFILDLMREEQVAFYTGSAYGEHTLGHFRTTVLNDIPTLEEAYNRLERFMKKRLK